MPLSAPFRPYRWLFCAALVGAVLALSGCAGKEAEHGAPSPPAADTTSLPTLPPDAPGEPGLYPATQSVEAPDFALETMGGQTFRLSEQRGKVVVVNLWATWCPPCRAEIPDFIALQQELGGRGLVIAGVSFDETGWEAVRPFAEKLGTNYPIMVDDGSVADAYGPVTVMPTTFLVGRSGHVAYYAPGMLTREVLQPVLLELLDETP